MSEEKSLFETMGIDYEERNGLLYPIFEEETATEGEAPAAEATSAE